MSDCEDFTRNVDTRMQEAVPRRRTMITTSVYKSMQHSTRTSKVNMGILVANSPKVAKHDGVKGSKLNLQTIHTHIATEKEVDINNF